MSHQTCLHLAASLEEKRLVSSGWGAEGGGGRLWYLILWLFLLLKRRWGTLALCLHSAVLVRYSHACRLLIVLRSVVLRRLLMLSRRGRVLLEEASWGAVLKFNTSTASLVSGANEALLATGAVYCGDLSCLVTFSIKLIILSIAVGVVYGWVCCSDVSEAWLIRILRLNCLYHLLTWCGFLILIWRSWEGVGLLLERGWSTMDSFFLLLIVLDCLLPDS